MRILSICGSLRAASINASLLRAAAGLAPPSMQLVPCSGIGQLPIFNPDDECCPPPAVLAWRAQIAAADGLLIASPEYAHGVTGAIKNALDWVVSFEPFAGKPVAVFNASPRAHHADDALRETLRTMAAQIIAPASIALPLLGAHLDEMAMMRAPHIAQPIQAALAALQEAIAASGAPLELRGGTS